jgi:S-(hydroxymethyl)glutathione dehydrogenase/alcohol dehydrogenase
VSTTRAAILVETGQPLVVDTIELPSLQIGQVLVDVAFSGVCHTQLLEARGFRGQDRFLPHLLGHEGSGRVRAVGEGVTKVAPGDNVILSWIRGSGAEFVGTRYAWGAQSVNAGTVTTFSQATVVSENRLTRVPVGVGMREAALLGCAVATGLGAAINVGQVRPGQAVVVYGAGGIGLSAICGAALAGATPLVAVDLQPGRLALARAMGATETINALDGLVEALRALAPAGFDVAIEATGRPSVMSQALSSVRPQGGTAVVVGNAHHGESLQIDPRELNQGKRLLGTWGGDNVPDRDFPIYARLVSSGRLHLQPLLEDTYSLSDVNRALDDLETGQAARPMLDMAA